MCRVASVVSNSLQLCRLWPARFVCQGVIQARILEPIGQDMLSYPCKALYVLLPQLPTLWAPGAARTPATQAAAPPPHLALRGTNPSPPEKPQEQTPGDGPHAEVEIKPQVKHRGSVAKEEDPKPPHQLYKLQVKSTRSTRHTLRLWEIWKVTEAPPGENAPVLTAVDLEARTHRSRARLDLSCPLRGPETSTVLGILGRQGGLWLPARERALTAVTQEKIFIIFTFWLVL